MCFPELWEAFLFAAFPMAKNTGLAATFSDGAQKTCVKIFSLVYVVICGALMLVYEPVIGGCVLAAAALEYLYYYRMSQKEFGGITGDLAGFHMQLCELVDRFRGSDRREIMRLVIGGAFQGKKDYVKNTFHLEDGEMQDGASASYEDIFFLSLPVSFSSVDPERVRRKTGIWKTWKPGSWKEIPRLS